MNLAGMDGAEMVLKLNPNSVNQIAAGTDIYKEGEPVSSIAMIIKGKVTIHNSGAKITMASGAFIGINDLYAGKYQSTYTACDELLIYVFPINHIDELEGVASVNKDYHGFMVASYYKIITNLDQIYQGLLKNGHSLYHFLKDTYNKYLTLAAHWGCKAKTSDKIEKAKPLEEILDMLKDRIGYYVACNALPLDVVKQFYSYGNAVTIYQVEDQVDLVNQQIEALKTLGEDFVTLAQCLVDGKDNSLFYLIAELYMEVSATLGSSDDLMDMMDGIIEEVNKAEKFIEKMLGLKWKVNRKKMEEVYHLLLTGGKGNEISSENFLKYSKEESERALEEMKDSFSTILNYAGIEEEKAAEMKTAIQSFLMLEDKFSAEDFARGLRKRLAENHYQIYYRVFLKAKEEEKLPRVIEMFLKYGFVDERLLTQEQQLSLYFLEEEEFTPDNCTVFNIYEWLTAIYEGKREPSKNEFDQDYTESITTMKKQGKITEKEATNRLTDPKLKVEYEIQNMFRYNNRTTSGQISSFVPFLHKDQWSIDISRMQVTPARVMEAIDTLLKVDYSIFDREVLYVNPSKNIKKEYIVKRIYPDIILMPNIGSQGVMWQELSGKRRDSVARFLLPIFTDLNLVSLLTKVFGRFRWELCRTIEGTAWNDIKHKSLTSEYSDYLQFYRKNKDLSEEKKEKLKLQIQKARNNSREIFVMDYEQWITYESTGAIKLNKPVREMLATYCPFAKEIREQLKLQPMFEEAMARYYREKQKKIREIEGRHRLLQKDQIEITQELIDTLEYYKNT